MTTKFKSGSVVTDNTLQFMKPAVEGNATVKNTGTGYIFMAYVEK